MTALTGGLFIFVCCDHPQFTTWLINHFFLIFAVVYPLLFIGETIVSTCISIRGTRGRVRKKARHIALGVLLNPSARSPICDRRPTSLMNTPVRAEGISPVEFWRPCPSGDKVFNQLDAFNHTVSLVT